MNIIFNEQYPDDISDIETDENNDNRKTENILITAHLNQTENKSLILSCV